METLKYNKPELLKRRRELRNKSTSAEAVLWDMLKSRQVLGLKFRRQYSVDNYILDFYCPQIRLGIELDGHDHYTPTGDTRDELRSCHLMEHHNIHIVRFENCDIFNRPMDVINHLSKICKELLSPNLNSFT